MIKTVNESLAEMIEVFKTDVQEFLRARRLIALLHLHFPGSRANFDLHDCDKILRVEGENLKTEEVIRIMKESGAACNLLE